MSLWLGDGVVIGVGVCWLLVLVWVSVGASSWGRYVVDIIIHIGVARVG